MKHSVGRTVLRSAARDALGAAIFASVAWCCLLLRPPESNAFFQDLAKRRAAELSRREHGEMSFWTHEPQNFAGRCIGPFVSRSLDLLSIVTLPAVILAERHTRPVGCAGLPLLRDESWEAFFRVVTYSGLLWLGLGFILSGSVRATKALWKLHRERTAGAG